MPDLSLETRLGAEHGRVVVGIDEAGRGPWAGPVVAAAAWLDRAALEPSLLAGLDDSKRLAPAARERLYRRLVAAAPGGARIGLGEASVAEIDRLNILQATLLAMARAVAGLGLAPDAAPPPRSSPR
jgi:ribonuclease HII